MRGHRLGGRRSFSGCQRPAEGEYIAFTALKPKVISLIPRATIASDAASYVSLNEFYTARARHFHRAALQPHPENSSCFEGARDEYMPAGPCSINWPPKQKAPFTAVWCRHCAKVQREILLFASPLTHGRKHESSALTHICRAGRGVVRALRTMTTHELEYQLHFLQHLLEAQWGYAVTR